jgi:beta-lactamase regulating signal transducer with metallopeptidase domain
MSWQTALLGIWALGALAILGRIIVGLVAVGFLSRRTQVITDAPWLPMAMDIAREMGVSSRLRFLRSGRAAMPVATGIFTPSVIMPEDADTWSESRLRVVLLHELAHVKRRDCLTHVLAQAACAFYWFNPLAWIGARQLRAERERACDDLVLSAGTRGADYAEHLLEIARVAIDVRPRLAAAAIAMARPYELEGRLLAILNPRLNRHGARQRLVWQVAIVAAAIALPVATVRLVGDEADASAPVEPPPIASPRAEPLTPAAESNGFRPAEQRSPAPSPLEHVSNGAIEALTVGPAEADSDSDGEDVGSASSDASDDDTTPGVSPAVVQALTDALEDSDAEVRQSAMHALARFRSPATYEAFIAGLKDEDAEVRQLAAFGLSHLRDARASDALILALGDKDAEVRQKAAFALSQLRTAQAVPALTAALEDPDDEVREQALFALTQIGDRSAVPALIAALADRNADVRKQAAFGLSQIGDQAAVPSLIAALRDAESDVREQAAFALSQIGDESALEALTAAIKDPVADVRQQAIFAISQIAERH